MPVPTLLAGRGPFLVVALLATGLALGACGRRGPLEPPAGSAPPAAEPAAPARTGPALPADRRLRPNAGARAEPTVAAATLATQAGSGVEDAPDEEIEDSTQTVSPTPTPRKRVRGYTVPKEPFILDPLL